MVQFFAMICIAVALSAGFAHLFEFPHKFKLSREEYLTVQSLYRGWALLGIAVVGALIATTAAAVMLRKKKSECIITSCAALFIALSLINFFFFTQPVNQETLNWTVIPSNWEALRNQWEISHVISASLTFVSYVLLTMSLLVRKNDNYQHLSGSI